MEITRKNIYKWDSIKFKYTPYKNKSDFYINFLRKNFNLIYGGNKI